jgi:nucleotide-binding universal stress UspA family protein
MATKRLFLVATDFSHDAQHAIYRTALLAREQQAGLLLLHVMNKPSLLSLKTLLGMPVDIDRRLQDQAVERLRSLAADVARDVGLDPQHRVVVGDTVEEVAAATEEADLLAVGAHGLSGLRDLVLGSISERLLQKCCRPVLVVKQPPETPYRRVLVPVAFGPSSAQAVRTALALAPGAETTVFTAFAVPFEATLQLAGLPDGRLQRYRNTARRDALRKLDALLAATGAPGARLRRSAEHGDASRLILAKESELDSDLIVIGKKGEPALQDMLLGSVTRHILSASRADVLVVGAEADQALPANDALAMGDTPPAVD